MNATNTERGFPCESLTGSPKTSDGCPELLRAPNVFRVDARRIRLCANEKVMHTYQTMVGVLRMSLARGTYWLSHRCDSAQSHKTSTVHRCEKSEMQNLPCKQ